MALSLNTEQFGIEINDAYVRVEQVRVSRFDEDIECVARFYVHKPDGIMAAFKETVFRAPYNPDAGNPYAQAYVGAKDLPEFAGAVDC